VKEAPLALPSAASGQREHGQRLSPPPRALARQEPRNVTRHGWPVDRSAQRLEPARLYRRHPHFRFGRGEDGMSWRELVLPERALRAAGSSKGF
jgi:hypothetical protein